MTTMKMSKEQAPTPRARDQDTGSVDSLWRRPGRKCCGRQELGGGGGRRLPHGDGFIKT